MIAFFIAYALPRSKRGGKLPLLDHVTERRINLHQILSLMSERKLFLAGVTIQVHPGQNEKSDRSSFAELGSLVRMNDLVKCT
jgi:hypothetical protein